MISELGINGEIRKKKRFGRSIWAGEWPKR